MKNSSLFSMLIILCLIGALVYQCNQKGKTVTKLITSTDTVYVDKPIKVEPEYKYITVSEKVYVYKTDTVKIKEVVVKTDTILIYLEDSTSLIYDPKFLTNFPNADKLINLKFDDKNLEMGLLTPHGNTYVRDYQINTNLYRYNYVNGNLSYKKKSFWQKISPTSQFTIRPINNMYDLDLGLKYNTSGINYEIGGNLFYYPNLKNNLGADFYLRLSYDF